jgi:hypothetical protein
LRRLISVPGTITMTTLAYPKFLPALSSMLLLIPSQLRQAAFKVIQWLYSIERQ